MQSTDSVITHVPPANHSGSASNHESRTIFSRHSLMQAPTHQLAQAQHFGVKDHQQIASTLFKDSVQQMPIAPESNKIFVSKAPPEGSNADAVYAKFVSTIDKQLLDQSSDAMNALLKRTHTLIGGDKHKEQFTMRGHLDSLELVLNDMVTELKYH